MDSEDAIRIFRELTIGNRIPCNLSWNGKRYTMIVPLFALRGGTLRFNHHRPMDMRDLNEEEMGIVIDIGNRAKLVVEMQRDQGVMTIW